MAIRGFSETRNITVTFTGDFSLDGHKAGLALIQRFERAISDGQSFTNISSGSEVKMVASGDHPFRIYIFDVSANFGTGDYAVAFLETAPNLDEATTTFP